MHRFLVVFAWTCIGPNAMSSPSTDDSASPAAHGIATPSPSNIPDTNCSMCVDCTNRDFLPPLQQYVWLLQRRKECEDFGLIPMFNASSPVMVGLNLQVGQLIGINERDMDFRLDVLLRQVWTDYRLAFERDIPGVENIGVPDQYYANIWLPDTYILNGKVEELHDVTMENKMFRVYKNGTVYYSQRLRLVLWCSLQLERFPLDTQNCSIALGSFRYSVSEVRVHWLNVFPHVELFHNAQELAMFTLNAITTHESDYLYITGTFSVIDAVFYFERRYGFYLTQVYAPSILIVMLSWVSFWLDPHSVPARVSLSILTILAMTNQLLAAAGGPVTKVSYIKALDVWLISCMSFLCATLVEFAIANTVARQQVSYKQPTGRKNSFMVREAIRKQLESRPASDVQPANTECILSCVNAELEKNRMFSDSSLNSADVTFEGDCPGQCMANKALLIDRLSRVVFPIAFVVFNIGYWSYYLT